MFMPRAQYYFAIKEIFDILALSFLSDNLTVFTSWKQACIKHQPNPASSTYTLDLIIEVQLWSITEGCSFFAATFIKFSLYHLFINLLLFRSEKSLLTFDTLLKYILALFIRYSFGVCNRSYVRPVLLIEVIDGWSIGRWSVVRSWFVSGLRKPI